MERFFKEYWVIMLGAVVGAVMGYFYYLKVGCASGTCPITSSPVMTCLFGALIVGLLLSIFKRKYNKDEDK